MAVEREYLEYVVVLSLSLIAVSASYLVQPSNYTSWVFLAIIPVSYGYTAYISRASFQKAALASFLVLLFIPLGQKIAAVALITAVGNFLVSVFAGGKRFRDYYSSTRLPLVLMGLMIGGLVFYAATSNPATADSIRSMTGEAVGAQSQQMIEHSNILESQQEAQIRLVNQTSQATVLATQAYVINRSQDDMSPGGIASVSDSFQDARSDIPVKVSGRMEEQLEDFDINVSARTADLVEGQLSGKRFLILIPFILLAFTALQPVVGLITAISAFSFSRIDESLS